MKRILIILGSVLIGLQCNKYHLATHRSDECQEYYKMMKADWQKMEGYYQIKGNPPYLEQGEYRMKYFGGKCLLDLNAKQLKRILGAPNRTPPQKGWGLHVYCLNPDCSHKFQIILDSLSRVKETVLNPEEISD